MSGTVLAAAGALAVGFFLGLALNWATIRRLRRRVRELRAGQGRTSILRSVTKFLFATTQVFALGWVSVSYGIAVYATVALEQPFPVTELSQQAITTILGVSALKVVENIFEHNEGVLFGRNRNGPPDEDAEEGEGVG